MPEPRPGPAARVSRSAGQGGAVLTILQLWQSFGWLGADHWTRAQAAARWPAITAASIVLAAAAQNAVNWWTTRRSDRAVR